MTCSIYIISNILSPTQCSISLQIPIIATHRGVPIEKMIRIILGLDGVKFLVIGAVEGLFPVHFTGIGLRHERRISDHVSCDKRLLWGCIYLTHVASWIRRDIRQSWNPFFRHLFRGDCHAGKVCTIRPGSKRQWLEHGLSSAHGETYDVSIILIADVLHDGFTELYTSLPTTAEDTFNPILTKTTPSSTMLRTAAVKSSLRLSMTERGMKRPPYWPFRLIE